MEQNIAKNELDSSNKELIASPHERFHRLAGS
jgi:hypothetical protein